MKCLIDLKLLLKNTILNYEPDCLSQWSNLPEEYKVSMEKGIIAFELEVEEGQAKKK